MPRKILKFEQRVGCRLSRLLFLQRPAGAPGLGFEPLNALRQFGNTKQIKVFTFDFDKGRAAGGAGFCGFFHDVFAPDLVRVKSRRI